MPFRIFYLFVCVLFVLSAVTALSETTAGQSETIDAPYLHTSETKAFPLHEVSAFEVNQQDLTRGQSTWCSDDPSTAVTRYPEVKSSKPLYGSVIFSTKPYLERRNEKLFYYVIDESTSPGAGYDILYFDMNRDGDLTNDRPSRKMSDPPKGATVQWQVKEQIFFDYIPVPIDSDSGDAIKAFNVLPRLVRYGEESSSNLSFLCPVARKGEIVIGNRAYQVILGQPYLIVGRWDLPSINMSLIRQGPEGYRVYWWGGDQLDAIHRIDDIYYTFSCTPDGKEFRVHTYNGDLGEFKLGKIDPNDVNVGMSGSLTSPYGSVAIGPVDSSGFPNKASSYTIPVGDYYPNYMTFNLGDISVDVSENYHSEGKPVDRCGRPFVYGIKIRKDKPFIMDFSNPPAVMFASPRKNRVYKAGDKIRVEAVLIDPVLDIMYRGMRDAQNKKIDVAVTITDSTGKTVNTGIMPFG